MSLPPATGFEGMKGLGEQLDTTGRVSVPYRGQDASRAGAVSVAVQTQDWKDAV